MPSIQVRNDTVYEVRGELDTTEGRAGDYLVGWYLHPRAANQAAENKGVWGQAGAVAGRPVRVLTDTDGQQYIVGEKINTDPFLEDPKVVRARALQKLAHANLTQAERAALKLDADAHG